MPVSTLFSLFKTNHSVKDFHEWYPGVDEELVIRLLEHIEMSLEELRTG